MKFDIFSWQEVKPNEEIQARKGVLRVRASAPVALYVQADGYEVLAGVGLTHEVDLSEAVIWRAEAPKGTRVFWQPPAVTSVRCEGEVYTNIDRMPHESGQVAEVTRALRMFELQRRQALREIRAERDALLAARAAQGVDDAASDAPEDAPAEDQGEGNEADGDAS